MPDPFQQDAVINTNVAGGGSSDFESVPPAELIAQLRPHFSALGITRVANVTGMDHVGIPTVMVVRPNARSLSVSQGKGCSLDAAKASGIMESLELWHAERIEAPLRLTSERELGQSVPVVDVRGLPAYVRPYQPSERVLWIEGHELRTGEPRWLPYEMVQLDLRLPLPTGSGFFLAGSNGLASGARLEEAVAHGLYETIERDAITLFLALPSARQWQCRVDLSTIDDPACQGLLQRYDEAKVGVAVWDTTSDLGVASFLCLAVDREHDPFRPVGGARGSGCHPCPGVALTRALCEAAQSRLTRIVGTRDDIQEPELNRLQTAESHARNLAIVQESRRPPRDFREIPSLNFPSAQQAVRGTTDLLAGRDLPEVVVVDLSRPELPAKVVRVVVPGLEAFCEMPGYQPGRRARAQRQELGR